MARTDWSAVEVISGYTRSMAAQHIADVGNERAIVQRDLDRAREDLEREQARARDDRDNPFAARAQRSAQTRVDAIERRLARLDGIRDTYRAALAVSYVREIDDIERQLAERNLNAAARAELVGRVGIARAHLATYQAEVTR